ncbi:MAG: AAA family ATPase [Desulfovibrionaceae bacterium]|nr:AAA family ATPase [Desulfovibrionaceae bacterium]
MEKRPTLYIFSGLPGVGKTTLAKRLASYLNATFLKIDTVEQALRDLCSFNVEGEGYRLSYRVAKDNLQNGNDVVADSCNPIQLTREEWQEVAKSADADFINIEIICTDSNIHKQRVESRSSKIPNLTLPSWQEILDREYHEWKADRVIIDTANKTIDESYEKLINYFINNNLG